ncbi:MAG: peptidase M14 [Candidatus Aminicenantes bacterium]|nr:peptidase M14 [Candidatus Aminicenantes bacterium]
MKQMHNNRGFKAGLLVLTVLVGFSLAAGQDYLPRKWNTRKVNLSFNKYYDWQEVEAALRSLEKAYPKFLKLRSAGKSYQGRELWYMTINNPDTGGEMEKCAFYMDANIHGNEIQGGEIGIYTIWYLMENYAYNDYVRKLVDERVFYIFPSVNPDGRDLWLHKGGSARSGQMPVDDDNDGLYDEDGPEDLDGDGEVGAMYIKVEPGKGTHRLSDKGDRLVPIEKNIEGRPDELGDYEYIGSEGLDNDDDGRYNEDTGGGYDPNRDWGAFWQPKHIQRGAGEYPFFWVESKHIRDFLYAHPNIAGVQAFHNSGGMILRGPAAPIREEFPRQDLAVLDEIGKKGEKIIEGYRYIVIWKDLYPVWGGFVEFTFDMLGIYSFTNELWTSRADLNKDGDISEEEEEFFEKLIDMDNTAVAMHEIDHPQLGKVLIDRDTTKLSGRVPPSWLLEELCHRNMAFCLLHAYEMPLPVVKSVSAEKIDGNLYRVSVVLYNSRLMPTMSQVAVDNKVQRPDILSIKGQVKVLAAGHKPSMSLPAGIPARFRMFFRRGFGDRASEVTFIDQKDPQNLKLTNGIPGRSEAEYQFLVEGKGKVTVTLDCVKGGRHVKEIELK